MIPTTTAAPNDTQDVDYLGDELDELEPSASVLEDEAREDLLQHQMQDESWRDATRREKDERRDAKLRLALASPKRAQAVYRDVALLHPALSHALFRVLSMLLRYSDPDLTNVFPSRVKVAEALDLTLPTYDSHLKHLRATGWVKTIPYHRENGQQSSSGVVFCIPAGVLPNGEPWCGPERFDNRLHGARNKRRRKSAEAGDD